MISLKKVRKSICGSRSLTTVFKANRAMLVSALAIHQSLAGETQSLGPKLQTLKLYSHTASTSTPPEHQAGVEISVACLKNVRMSTELVEERKFKITSTKWLFLAEKSVLPWWVLIDGIAWRKIAFCADPGVLALEVPALELPNWKKLRKFGACKEKRLHMWIKFAVKLPIKSRKIVATFADSARCYLQCFIRARNW